MNTVWISCIGILLSLGGPDTDAQDCHYCREYELQCQEAIVFWLNNKERFEALSELAGVSPRLMFAIVAPEISQYGRLADKAQIYALKTFYVRKGSAYSDFSIGLFQMKPSFIERLEKYNRAELLPPDLCGLLQFSGTDEKEIRAERIRRLEQSEWQMRYLALFCLTLSRRFPGIEFDTEDDKLRFYANAYNRGFLLDAQQLLLPGDACFPRFSVRKYRYSDVSLWFYHNAP